MRPFAPRPTALYMPLASRQQARNIAQGYKLWIGHMLYQPFTHWMTREATRLGIPYWAIPHGGLDPYVFRRIGWVKKLWMRRYGHPYLSNAKRVLFATKREQEKASPYYSGSNTHWLYWPMESVDLSHRQEKRKAFRERFSISDQSRLLLYLGRLHSMKRPQETIEAFLKCAPKHGHLMLVGMDGDTSADSLRKRYGNTSCITIAGPLYGNDKNMALCAADGFVSLSFRENFGYTTAEAASAGLPMILSRGNDLGHDLPEPSRWLLPDESVEQGSQAMNQFFSTPKDELERRGETGHDWTRQELTMDKFQKTIRTWLAEDIQVTPDG